MKTRLAIMTLLLFCVVSAKVVAQTTDTASLVDTVYIPADLPDCMRTLDAILSDTTKDQIFNTTRADFGGLAHFSLGLWIRNNWGLWRGSRLQSYFFDNGIRHPDDMSGLILDCYWQHLHGHSPNYRRLLRKESRAEQKWIRKQEESRHQENLKYQEWEFLENYEQPFDDSTRTIESSTAPLNLPLKDNVTGAEVRLRLTREDTIGHTETDCLKHNIHREAHWTPRPDQHVRRIVQGVYGREPYGPVKQITITESKGYISQLDFNPDGTLARYLSKGKKKTCSEFVYDDKKLSAVRHIVNDTLKRAAYYSYFDNGRCHVSIVRYISDKGTDTTFYDYWFSAEGQPLRLCGENDYLFQYDSTGRLVNELSYQEGRLSKWLSYVYNDSLNVYYEINKNADESIVYAVVRNNMGDVLGECFIERLDIFDHEKTAYSYSYDKYGNWTKSYILGKLDEKCKIKYYRKSQYKAPYYPSSQAGVFPKPGAWILLHFDDIW